MKAENMKTETPVQCSDEDLKAIPLLGIRELKPLLGGGLMVQKLDRFGPCAKAGVNVGDEILAINGERLPAQEVDEVAQGICVKIGVGGAVQLSIRRAGEAMKIPVVLRAKKSLDLNIHELSEVLERKIAP